MIEWLIVLKHLEIYIKKIEHHLNPQSHRTANTLRPGNPHQITVCSPGYQKNAPLCDCNMDRAALARRSDGRTLWAQLRSHYHPCVSATLILRPHGAQDTRSVRPSAIRMRPYSDATTTALRCLSAPAVSVAHTRRLYNDPTATSAVSLYIWLHSMAS